jgi:CrcB protein
MVWVAVALLGSLGALARYHVDTSVERRTALGFPLGTLVVNASGSLVLGFLTGHHVSGNALLLEGTATIGAYTTFSTWMLETHRLADEGELGLALANIVLSMLVGLACAGLGWALGAAL